MEGTFVGSREPWVPIDRDWPHLAKHQALESNLAL